MFRAAALTVAVCLIGLAQAALAAPPRPPAQPARGPGGREYAHESVEKSFHGSGTAAYWLFEPSHPAPASAPVVVFLHGWSQMNPRSYGAWIDHLVRRGHVVIYPLYQANVLTAPREFMPGLVTAARDALDELGRGARVRPRRDRVAIVGHSCGGLLAANLAAIAADEKLPAPRAVMCIQPGRSNVFPMADLSRIAPETLLVTLASDFDRVVGAVDAARIYRGATRVPAANKDFVYLRSDTHGSPAISGHHNAPLALDLAYDAGTNLEPAHRVAQRSGRVVVAPWERPPNATDYWAFWRPFDALCEAAFAGGDRAAALGGGAARRYMGKWSDGVAVRELVVEAPE